MKYVSLELPPNHYMTILMVETKQLYLLVT